MLKVQCTVSVGVRLLLWLLAALAATAVAAETNAPPAAAQSGKTATPPRVEPAPRGGRVAPRKLSGAELYSIHCNRCHPERYPTERTAAQWKTILLHMRVRANLPAEQARTILKYLQDNSGR